MPTGDTKNANGWEPSQAVLTNGSDNRSPTAYRAVVEQFDVTYNPRYVKRDGKTFCNIFLWDVTRALACEIPHWWGTRELNANDIAIWLTAHGADFGWKRITTAESAAKKAALGFPTVAAWHNVGGTGHVAVVIPGKDRISIAQAGAFNLWDEPLEKGFGTARPIFYSHD